MGRFCGNIGFLVTKETSPGVWTESIKERLYYGDVLRTRHSWEKTQYLNDNVSLSNDISIVADDYAKKNLGFMKYVCLNDSKWTIAGIEVEYPRLRITIGGLYNGPEN